MKRRWAIAGSVICALIAAAFFSRHQIVETAWAQLSCSAQSQSVLLGQFSDNAPVGSISPANIRNVICSSLNVSGDGSQVTVTVPAGTSAVTLSKRFLAWFGEASPGNLRDFEISGGSISGPTSAAS